MSFIAFVIFMIIATPTIIYAIFNEDKLIEIEDKIIESIKAKAKSIKK